jgi:hypothetical protein
MKTKDKMRRQLAIATESPEMLIKVKNLCLMKFRIVVMKKLRIMMVIR